MKIRRIAAYRVELAVLHEGRYKWSGGKSVGVFDPLLVRVATDTGLVGHGEVCPLGAAYLPAHAQGVRAGLGGRAEPDGRRTRAARADLHERMDAVLKGQPTPSPASTSPAAISSARQQGLPVAALLGGSVGRAMASLPGDLAGVTGEMAAKVAGLSGGRLSALPAQGRRRSGHRRRAHPGGAGRAGAGDVLIAHANTGWLPHQAARVVRAVRDLDVYIEQPCATYEECLWSGARPTIRSFSMRRSRLGRALCGRRGDGAMDVVNLKIGKLGGLTRARQMRDLCAELGHRHDDRGQLGRRHRHGRDRPSGPQHTDGAAVHGDRLQQLRDRRRRPTGAPQREQRPHGGLAGAGPRDHAPAGGPPLARRRRVVVTREIVPAR